MHNEISHLRIVHGLLCLGAPRRIGGGIIRKDADDIDLAQILEFGGVELREFAAEHEMKKLLW